jgi:hypothetical protein
MAEMGTLGPMTAPDADAETVALVNQSRATKSAIAQE